MTVKTRHHNAAQHRKDIATLLNTIDGYQSVVQVQYSLSGAVSTGTTTMPDDDTIPQNTEGDEYLTQAITPGDTANLLKIEVVFNYATSAGDTQTVALFQDSTAGALACSHMRESTANLAQQQCFTHWMTAGTTSETTFKVRSGNNAAGTTTFNGQGGARTHGGVMASSITITEIKA